MLRSIVKLYAETKALESCRGAARGSPAALQTVLLSSQPPPAPGPPPASPPGPPPGSPPGPPPGSPPGPPPGPQSRRPSPRAWGAAAALIAALGGGVLYFSKLKDKKITEEFENKPEIEVSELPESAQYVVVGGGTAAFSAARAVRSRHPSASVLLLSAEGEPPYMRPPLARLRAPRPYEPAAFYCEPARLGEPSGGVALSRGWRAERLLPDGDGGLLELGAPDGRRHRLRYRACLLASGSRPRPHPRLEAARAAGLAGPLRSAADLARVRARLEGGARSAAVLGGDARACQLAAELARSVPAVLLCEEERPMAAELPEYLSAELAESLREAGVAVRTGARLAGAAAADGEALLRLEGGEELRADLVVETAEEADAAVAARSGLEVAADGGVAVNSELAALSHVWAAGDAASYWAGRRRRAASHDHAVQSGRLAGDNMAASVLARSPELRPPGPAPLPARYSREPMTWAEVGPDALEGVGELDSSLRTVGVWAPRDDSSEVRRRGVLFYLRDSRVVGVLLWNLLDRIPRARQVLEIAEFDDLMEVAKLFHVEEEDS